MQSANHWSIGISRDSNMENVRDGNHDRGWNDPPQFLYDAQQRTQAQTGGVGATGSSNLSALKKRVGHDLSAINSGEHSKSKTISPKSAQLGPDLAPPPPTLSAVPIATIPQPASTTKTQSSNVDLQLPSFSDDEELVTYCASCFRRLLNEQVSAGYMQNSASLNIEKKIQIFEQNAKSGKISAEAKPKCVKLARALEINAFDCAHEAHLQLMTDHISEVNQWMVGVKKLIQTGKENAIVP